MICLTHWKRHISSNGRHNDDGTASGTKQGIERGRIFSSLFLPLSYSFIHLESVTISLPTYLTGLLWTIIRILEYLLNLLKEAFKNLNVKWNNILKQENNFLFFFFFEIISATNTENLLRFSWMQQAPSASSTSLEKGPPLPSQSQGFIRIKSLLFLYSRRTEEGLRQSSFQRAGGIHNEN